MAALALFIWRELVAPEPFLHLGGFAFRTVALTMLASAFWCAALYGVAIQLPNCLLVLGYEHWKTGWVILPMGLIVLAAMFLGGFVWQRGALVWLFRIGLAGMTVVGFWLARIDIYTPWQWVMGVSSLWAVFAGMCMSPIAQLTFEGQPPAMAGATGAMKFFMRSFNGTVGILLAGVLIDQGAWWGLDFVRDAIVQGQGAVQADVPGIRDHLVRHGSTPAEAVAQSEAVLGLLGQPARPGHRLPQRPALLRLPERGRAARLVFHQPTKGAEHLRRPALRQPNVVAELVELGCRQSHRPPLFCG